MDITSLSKLKILVKYGTGILLNLIVQVVKCTQKIEKKDSGSFPPKSQRVN